MEESTPTPVATTKSLQNVEEQSIVTENVAAIESTAVESATESDEEPVVEEPVVEEPVAEEVKSSNNDLEERVKALEERLEKLVNILRCEKGTRISKKCSKI